MYVCEGEQVGPGQGEGGLGGARAGRDALCSEKEAVGQTWLYKINGRRFEEL